MENCCPLKVSLLRCTPEYSIITRAQAKMSQPFQTAEGTMRKKYFLLVKGPRPFLRPLVHIGRFFLVRYQPYPRYSSSNSNSSNGSTVTTPPAPQSSILVKTETNVSSVSTSGAPLSPLLVEPHSNTSTPLVDEPNMTNQRQRNGTGEDGERNKQTRMFYISLALLHSS